MALDQPPRIWKSIERRPITVRKAAAIAMFGTPLLVAPSLATVSPTQPRVDRAGSAAMVINSAPTIVINSCPPDDIEHRVLEALKQHREAIYVQWSREMQRRQRTEF
jgi:hypothetical protein